MRKRTEIDACTNKQTNARETHRPAPSSPSEVIIMLNRIKKNKQKKTKKKQTNKKTNKREDKEQKHHGFAKAQTIPLQFEIK